MTRVLLLAAALLAAPAVAQQQPPAQTPPKEPAKERRTLNLQLDNPSSFATTAPAEKGTRKDLPALGGDARKTQPVTPLGEKSSDGPYPKDTNPTR